MSPHSQQSCSLTRWNDTDIESGDYQHWQRDWPRAQCVTVAQVRTGHSPLVAAYLHRIGRRDSAICPHCHSTDEMVEHLVFQCPAHDHARRDTWPGDTFTTDLRCLWSYLERIGAVTRPLTGNERERERVEICAFPRVHLVKKLSKEENWWIRLTRCWDWLLACRSRPLSASSSMIIHFTHL